MIDGSIDSAPTSTMFIRTGGNVRKRNDHAASASAPTGTSPARVIVGFRNIV